MENSKKLKPYFHNISHTEICRIRSEDLNYIENNYRPPYWCGYEFALSKDLGCVSLMDLSKNKSDRKKISVSFCQDCDMFKK